MDEPDTSHQLIEAAIEPFDLADAVENRDPNPYGEWRPLSAPLPRSTQPLVGGWDGSPLYPHGNQVQPGCERRPWGVVHVKPGCRCPRVTGRAR